MVNRLAIVGGGSAGFLAAITFKARAPGLAVTVVRSRDIPIIGVGEGSTGILTRHLHGYLGIDFAEFYRLAEPQWKLGIRFLWGRRPFFDYSFAPQLEQFVEGLPRSAGYYCEFADKPLEYAGIGSALMSHDKVFVRRPDGRAVIVPEIAYHVENEKFVEYLERYAQRLGVQILDETITEVLRDEAGVAGLRFASGAQLSADLYIDCSGFRSMLLGQALGEPFVSFKPSLFCDRAVVGGWERSGEPIKPYTTAETMDAGWCWRIEHETRINRGYVYSSAFISDEAAEREFLARNPKVERTRLVTFVSGRYERSWVKNVVAIGNASGFVEPLESTALGFICTEAVWLIEGLLECECEVRPSGVKIFNRRVSRGWDVIRGFLAVHYRFNARLETEFWRACRADTDLAGAADIVECYQENGPTTLFGKSLLDPDDQFTMEGYLAMLVGQQVPYHSLHGVAADQRQIWERFRQRNRALAENAFGVDEALAMIRSPYFRWPGDLYPRLCRPAPPPAREATRRITSL
jgi:tryptophan 7-halogenase